jgi:hypothetical protein
MKRPKQYLRYLVYRPLVCTEPLPDLSRQGTELTDVLDSDRKRENTVSIPWPNVETPEGKNCSESGTLILNPNEKS